MPCSGAPVSGRSRPRLILIMLLRPTSCLAARAASTNARAARERGAGPRLGLSGVALIALGHPDSPHWQRQPTPNAERVSRGRIEQSGALLRRYSSAPSTLLAASIAGVAIHLSPTLAAFFPLVEADGSIRSRSLHCYLPPDEPSFRRGPQPARRGGRRAHLGSAAPGINRSRSSRRPRGSAGT